MRFCHPSFCSSTSSFQLLHRSKPNLMEWYSRGRGQLWFCPEIAPPPLSYKYRWIHRFNASSYLFSSFTFPFLHSRLLIVLLFSPFLYARLLIAASKTKCNSRKNFWQATSSKTHNAHQHENASWRQQCNISFQRWHFHPSDSMIVKS